MERSTKDSNLGSLSAAIEAHETARTDQRLLDALNQRIALLEAERQGVVRRIELRNLMAAR
jgi:hypothetical protein